ncbi:MAG: hypothetical protein RLZZ210_812 [Pseudomonadota bacterium]|jgi:hypothetical protein
MLHLAKTYSILSQYHTKNYNYYVHNTLRLVPRNYIGSIKNWNSTSLAQFSKIYQYNFVYSDCANTKPTTLDIIKEINKILNNKCLRGKKIDAFIENNTINYHKNKHNKLCNGFIWYLDNIPNQFTFKDSWITFLECLEQIVEYWNNLGVCFRIFYRSV